MGPSTKQILMLTTSTLVVTCNINSNNSSGCVSALSPAPVGLASILSRKTRLNYGNDNNENYDDNVLNSSSIVNGIRGGASSTSSSSTTSKKKKKKKKKPKKIDDDDDIEDEEHEGSSSSSSSDATATSKKVIDDAMKEKDAAEALGDAIRDRADVLRSEDPLLQSIDWSVSSVGTALGASDQRMKQLMKDDDGGGIEAATTSILANYFIKSHGGAHALQCVCSFLATICGLGAIIFHKTPSWGYVLLQRTMLFAMVKHVSGLLASAAIAAKAIPKIGLGQARQWMEQIALDPVSQYVFYTALILLWLPPKERVDSCWWWNNLVIAPSMLVGPILLREVISTMLVISDMLVLSTMGDNSSNGIQTVLEISQSTINAGMSLLVSPEIWRNADPQQRQAILGKLVSRISLAFEVVVGLLLFADLGIGFVQTAFMSGQNRPPIRESLTRFLCVRLYLHFLWIRRKRISQLAVQIRGGASQLPIWFLDVLYDPAKSMGLDSNNKVDKEEEMNKTQNDGTVSTPSFTWKDYVLTAIGIN